MLGRPLGEGNGNPLQYSFLEISMDRGAWWATVHGAAKSQTRLRKNSNFIIAAWSYWKKGAVTNRPIQKGCTQLIDISWIYLSYFLFLISGSSLVLRLLSSCSEQASYFILWLTGSRVWAQQSWCMGFIAPRPVGSSRTRDRNSCSLYCKVDCKLLNH